MSKWHLSLFIPKIHTDHDTLANCLRRTLLFASRDLLVFLQSTNSSPCDRMPTNPKMSRQVVFDCYWRWRLCLLFVFFNSSHQKLNRKAQGPSRPEITTQNPFGHRGCVNWRSPGVSPCLTKGILSFSLLLSCLAKTQMILFVLLFFSKQVLLQIEHHKWNSNAFF